MVGLLLRRAVKEEPLVVVLPDPLSDRAPDLTAGASQQDRFVHTLHQCTNK
jgi:hypothetical protein